MIPSGWKKCSFGNLVTLSKSKYNPRKEQEDYPCIELEHISQNTGKILGSVNVKELASIKNKFSIGDILFGKLRPYLRKFAMPSFIGVCSTEISTGSKMPRADWDIVSNVIINLPPLAEQTKIAEILTTWDNAIDTTEKLLSNTEQQKKALMQQLLTGKKRLKDEKGNVFCGEWIEKRIKDFGKVVTGSTPPKNDIENYGNEICWATAEDFQNKYITETKVKLSKTGGDKARVIPKGSIFVTCIASIGKNAIANNDMATNQQINSIVVNKEYSNEFLYYIIDFYNHKLLSVAGVTAVPIVNKSTFEKIKFKVPPLEEQKAIAKVLTNVDNHIVKIKEKLTALKQEKKALMQVLLSGKVRV